MFLMFLLIRQTAADFKSLATEPQFISLKHAAASDANEGWNSESESFWIPYWIFLDSLFDPPDITDAYWILSNLIFKDIQTF